MTAELTESAAALVEIMALPDPVELLDLWGCPRGHRVTQEGDPEREAAVPWLAIRYAMHLRNDREQGVGERPRLS